MIRVGTLTDASLLDPDAIDNKSLMSPAEQLEAIFADTRALIEKKDAAYKRLSADMAGGGDRASRPLDAHRGADRLSGELLPRRDPADALPADH